MTRGAAIFCLGLWVMGTVCVSVVATQNFYTIDRLLTDSGQPRFDAVTDQVGDETRDFLRYLSSELNRLFFRYWNVAQFLIGGVAMWLVLRLPEDASLRWPMGVMLAILVVLTFGVTPPIISIGRGLDFVPRDPPPPSLARFNLLHAAYASLEMFKAAIGLWVGYRLSRTAGQEATPQPGP